MGVFTAGFSGLVGIPGVSVCVFQDEVFDDCVSGTVVLSEDRSDCREPDILRHSLSTTTVDPVSILWRIRGAPEFVLSDGYTTGWFTGVSARLSESLSPSVFLPSLSTTTLLSVSVL